MSDNTPKMFHFVKQTAAILGIIQFFILFPMVLSLLQSPAKESENLGPIPIPGAIALIVMLITIFIGSLSIVLFRIFQKRSQREYSKDSNSAESDTGDYYRVGYAGDDLGTEFEDGNATLRKISGNVGLVAGTLAIVQFCIMFALVIPKYFNKYVLGAESPINSKPPDLTWLLLMLITFFIASLSFVVFMFFGKSRFLAERGSIGPLGEYEDNSSNDMDGGDDSLDDYKPDNQ